MSDHDEIINLIEGKYKASVHEYADKQAAWINDYNNGNYNDIIMFNLNQQTANTILVPKDIRVDIPITVTGSGTPFTGPLEGLMVNGTKAGAGGLDVVAMRPSSLAFIRKIELRFVGNQSVDDGDNTYMINNLRIPVEKNSNWYDNVADEYYYGFDDEPTVNTGASPNTINTSILPYIYQATGVTAQGINIFEAANGNMGLVKRAEAFFTDFAFNAAGETANSYTGTLHINLKDVSDLFLQFNMPVIGFTPQLWIYLTFQNNQSTANALYAPIMSLIVDETVTPIPDAGTAGMIQPVLKPGPAPVIKIGNNGTNGRQCTLWYESITFDEEIGSKFIKLLEKGYTKKIEYVVSQIDNSQTGIKADTQILYTPLPGVIDPKRLWILAYNNGKLTSPGDIGIFNMTAKLTNINIFINGTKYFSGGDLTDPYRIYDQLKQNMPGYGVSDTNSGLLDYLNWRYCSRVVLLDFHRVEHLLAAPGQQNQIQVQFTNPQGAGINGLGTDYVYVMEMVRFINLEFTAAGVRFLKQ